MTVRHRASEALYSFRIFGDGRSHELSTFEYRTSSSEPWCVFFTFGGFKFVLINQRISNRNVVKRVNCDTVSAVLSVKEVKWPCSMTCPLMSVANKACVIFSPQVRSQ